MSSECSDLRPGLNVPCPDALIPAACEDEVFGDRETCKRCDWACVDVGDITCLLHFTTPHVEGFLVSVWRRFYFSGNDLDRREKSDVRVVRARDTRHGVHACACV